MTQLRIRKKSEEIKHPTQTFLPVALVLTVGMGITLTWQASQVPPGEALRETRPAIAGAARMLLEASLLPQSFQIDGHAWKIVTSPFPVSFDPAEMVPVGRTGPWRVVANRVRGVEALGTHAHAYDRPYLDIGKGHYVALRWRDVPSK